VLVKRISANGNPKANVAVDYEGLGGEQGTDVCEVGISSELSRFIFLKKKLFFLIFFVLDWSEKVRNRQVAVL
jgi:hypothetical protein